MYNICAVKKVDVFGVLQRRGELFTYNIGETSSFHTDRSFLHIDSSFLHIDRSFLRKAPQGAICPRKETWMDGWMDGWMDDQEQHM